MHFGRKMRRDNEEARMDELSDKDRAKLEVEQLRKEVKLERQLVSKCAEELKDYIESQTADDILVKGIAEDKNPFKEKGGCVIT
ncbi:guanine nucleotide-binding protein G(T) subunit gamma-T1 isoform X1 [Callorhinchus milii]|nr:guanine nucleotide-binding protein G(T) subunit gamma-T1 isoform X1 [Callorhinchus milii]|eukprot:gi/632974145/ref/XP_007903509.1/ PREDICTED: guanine nucleotide-binding protein G(I)/G(S)/G(O) subunit gamma-11-like isoform X1 [Callorhinchus milii]